MSAARYVVGDVFDVLATIPDGSVDLVLTSPPFLALRSYLPADHPDKAKEIGSEPNPAAFLDTLLALTAEWRRVLAPHGSICVELGDTYSGSGGAGGDYAEGGMREGQPMFRQGYLRNDRPSSVPQESPKSAGKPKNNRANQPDAGPRTGPGRTTKVRPDWPMDKSLCGIPHLYHLSLAYGRNLLTGEPSPAGSWRIRNVVAWCRPNPPVGALGDKFRPGTSYMTIATVARDRYFDLDAVRVPFTGHAGVGTGVRKGQDGAKPEDNRPDDMPTRMNTHDGAPPLDWWSIPTQAFAGAHYATWPMALCERPIKAMVPQRVCTTCGEPSRRLTSTEQEDTGRTTNGRKPRDRAESFAGTTYASRTVARVTTEGWSDCGHDTWRTGIVLDPFAGSGTTLAAATGHGREAIGIDLDERNADLAAQRVGMFLTVEHLATERAS